MKGSEMPENESIPPPIQRFILTSIDSVPHLEAVLLLRAGTDTLWDVKTVAQRLFIGEKRAAEIMDDLTKSGFVVYKENGIYSYEPSTDRLREAVDDLVGVYSKHLIEVTNLIHSKISKQAQKFGDAFRWTDEG